MSHPVGTDSLGRDNISRIIWGGRVSLQVGLLAMVIATAVAVSSGLAAGYYGRWIDTVIMRVVDGILAFPALLLAILMVAVLGPSLRNAMLAIAVGFIPSFAGSPAPIRCPSARRSMSRAREPSAPAPYG